jgi:hypothetical protein
MYEDATSDICTVAGIEDWNKKRMRENILNYTTFVDGATEYFYSCNFSNCYCCASRFLETQKKFGSAVISVNTINVIIL